MTLLLKKRVEECFESSDTYVKKAMTLLQEVASRKNKSVIKEIVEVCRIQLESGDVAPMSKLCAAKLLKDLFDLAIFPIIDEIERQILIPFCNIIEYRCEVKSINRGSTLFLQNMQKCINFQEECRKKVSIANSYFTLIHECIYFWSKFISSTTRSFRQVYEKMSKVCAFPTEFRYFKPGCVQSYHQQLQQEQESIEYEIEELSKLWMGSREKLKEGKELAKICRAIAQDCEEFSINYKERMKELQESQYYEKDKLISQMDRLKKEMKEFMELERLRKFDEIIRKFAIKNDEQSNERSDGPDTKRSNKSAESKEPSKGDTSKREKFIEPKSSSRQHSLQEPSQTTLKQLSKAHSKDPSIKQTPRQPSQIPKPPQLAPNPQIYQSSQEVEIEQPAQSNRHLMRPPTIPYSKAQKLKKQPKNIPSFKTIVANIDKGRSIGEFDTTALDALTNPKTSSRQNTTRTKKDNIFQKVGTLCEIESLEIIETIEQENKKEKDTAAKQIKELSQQIKSQNGEQPVYQTKPNMDQIRQSQLAIQSRLESQTQKQPIQAKELGTASHHRNDVKDTTIQPKQQLDQRIKSKTNNANNLPAQQFQSPIIVPKKQLCQRTTVAISIDSQPIKQPKRRNFRMSRLKSITLEHSTDKIDTKIQTTNHLLNQHHLYSYNIHMNGFDQTADTSCQTEKQNTMDITQMMDRTESFVPSRQEMPYPSAKSAESRRSSLTINRQKSSSRRKLSSGTHSANNFPADTLLGHLYQRRACLI